MPIGVSFSSAFLLAMAVAGKESAGAGTPRFSYLITERQAGIRFDQFLSQNLPQLSRSQLTAALRTGHILVDGILRKSSYRLKAGDSVTGEVPAPAPLDVQPEEMELIVLYEDDFLLAISKPPGLVVHPGSGVRTGTLVGGLVHRCATIADVGDRGRPGLVHRLDKDTSGVMVIAKDQTAHRRLVRAFSARAIEKEYVALVHGRFEKKTGRLVAPIARHPVHRQRMTVKDDGRYAATRWRVDRELGGKFSLLTVGIETGRTHQIRVHMAHLGHPVAGDRLYGGKKSPEGFVRQMLHAHRIRFAHPVTGGQLDIEAPLWPDFAEVIADLERRAP